MTRKTFTLSVGFLVLSGFLAAAVFLTRPDIDLVVAGYFANGTQGFPLRRHPAALFFNELINIAALVAALVSILGWIMVARLHISVAGLWARHYQFLLAALVTGPGLVANALFKENWGRARPRQILEFGGSAEFSPPLLVADQCSSNCSFVSGDASMGFFFLAVALLVTGRHRILAILSALAFGTFIGGIRIVQGAHFLSDVIFAGVFVSLTILLLYRLMIMGKDFPEITVPSLARQLGLAGTGPSRRPEGRSPMWIFFRARPQDLDVEPRSE